MRAGKIGGASPATFRYWVRVAASAGANTVVVNQAITSGNFRTLFKLSSASNVYNTACATGFSPTFTSSAITNVTTGTVTVSFTAPSAGTYYVTVNYTWTSIKNKAVPSPTTVPYVFSTTGVVNSSMPLSLHQ
jgi:hypothetical protein